MATTEAKKKAAAKYQSKTIASLACRVKKEQAANFKTYCAQHGQTSNAMLKNYVLDCIGAWEGPKNAAGIHGAGRGVLLSPEVLNTAQEAAQATGETWMEFIIRAIGTQVQRDVVSLRVGINPATGDKLEPDHKGGETNE